MSFDELVASLSVSDEKLGAALEALKIDVKDDYTKDEVEKLRAQLKADPVLTESASSGNGNEPDSRIFGPPSPGLDDEIPVLTMTLSPTITPSTGAISLIHYSFDPDSAVKLQEKVKAEAHERLMSARRNINTYADSLAANIRSDLDTTAAIIHSDALSRLSNGVASRPLHSA